MAKNDDLYDLLEGVKIDIKNSVGETFSLDAHNSESESPKKEEIKFTFYLKIRQLKQLAAILQNILLKKEEERELWVNEHQGFLNQLMMMVLANSNLSLENIGGDREMSALSLDLAMNLKKTITLLNSLVYGAEGLDS